MGPVRIGVPTEIKESERRVALVPAGVRELVREGNELFIERGAGLGSGFDDDQYALAGATIVDGADAVFDRAELIVKVKEPQGPELERLGPHHIVFGYLHLAGEPELTARLLATGATCIAYETVRDAAGRLPLLAPMSEIAGRLAAQLGAYQLFATAGGAGTLLGGVPGVPPARVVIIGGGVVGRHAAAVALALGAEVAILDRSLPSLREIDATFGRPGLTQFYTQTALEEVLSGAQLVIGAVLLPGARAPHVMSRRHLSLLADGALVIDVSIDQGGCIETSAPTTHSEPVRWVDGVRHSAITNLPAAVPRTATRALTNATLPYVQLLANLGLPDAVAADAGLGVGVSIRAGELLDRVALVA